MFQICFYWDLPPVKGWSAGPDGSVLSLASQKSLRTQGIIGRHVAFPVHIVTTVQLSWLLLKVGIDGFVLEK